MLIVKTLVKWPGTESNRRRQPFQGCSLPGLSRCKDCQYCILLAPKKGSKCNQMQPTARSDLLMLSEPRGWKSLKYRLAGS